MSDITTRGNQIIVDTPEAADSNDARSTQASDLVSWIVSKVDSWETHRVNGYQTRWAEYWRLWRGQWAESDKNRGSERSRLIAPALAQAIDATVAEIEEGALGREVWFDIDDDLADKERVDALLARDQLLEDLDTVGAKSALSDAILNAAIFGTGIVKIGVELRDSYTPERDAVTQELRRSGSKRAYVCWYSIRPDEFVPDPTANNVTDMLGCAHRSSRSMHSVLEKIEAGVYERSALGELSSSFRAAAQSVDPNDPQVVLRNPDIAESVDIIEWHGKVPLKYLIQASGGDSRDELSEALGDDEAARGDADDATLVEAIVTIANSSVLLRADTNPFIMQDRCIIAFPFEAVPGRFWGRGVAEKGYNPQKALDSELRARQDTLGYISAPMVAIDSGRVPRGLRMEVKPGKVWLLNGPPAEIMQPFNLGDVNAATFNQTQEMERMVQMGTGAFDTALPLRAQSQSGANAASSNSGLMGAFVKRAKRALRHIDALLFVPLIKQTMWRYMQFEPRLYPADYVFNVKATLGIVAREVESAQLTQLLGMLPDAAPGVALEVARGIIENSSVTNKAAIVQAVEAAQQPPSPEDQQRMKQLQDVQFEAALAEAQGKLLENQKTIAEIQKLVAETQAAVHEGRLDAVKAGQEQQRIGLQQQELAQFGEQNRIAMRRLDLQKDALELRARQQQSTTKTT